MSFHKSFASAEAEYYSDAARERLSSECEYHDGQVRYECEICEEEQQQYHQYTHDWRLCPCDTCDVTRTEYELEMGE